LAVIVIRYFGGTLLGLPGLTNAYKTATLLALQTTPIEQRAIEINYHLDFDYTKMNDVMAIVKKYKCSILKQQTELFCAMDIGIPMVNLELATLKLKEIRGVELKRVEL
jgi:putative IMPACT (imprinted ancient) family translation regulator